MTIYSLSPVSTGYLWQSWRKWTRASSGISQSWLAACRRRKTRLQSYFADGNYLYSEEHIGQVNDFIRDWAKAKGYPVADLARAVREQSAEVLEPDGLHLNGRGQLMLSKLLLELLP